MLNISKTNSLVILFLILLIPLVSSQTITSEPYYKQGVNTTIPLPCTINGDYCSANATCKTTIINPENLILFNNYNMVHNDAVFEVTLNSTQTEVVGEYQFNVVCSDNGKSISRFLKFYVTPNGENPSIAKGVIYMGLIIVLLLLIVGVSYSFFTFDNLLNRISMLGVGYLLFISVIFVSWNMSASYLTDTPFLTDTFRLLFWVLIAGTLPLLIGFFAFYTIQQFKIKEIQRLMDKGMDMNEAERRTSSKKYKH